MGSLKSLTAALAAAALVVAACAGPAEEGWTPAPDQPGQQPGQEQPGESPALQPGESPDASPADDNGLDDNGTDNGLGDNGTDAEASPEGQVGQQTQPEPEATPGLTDDQDQGMTPAVAVVDHAGSLTLLQDGQCDWTSPDQPGTTVAGQPGDGATLTLSFDQMGQQPTDPLQPTESPEPGMSPEPGTETPGVTPTDPTTGDASLELTIELSRGFPAPADDETDEPDTTPTEPTLTAEHVLPFTLTEQQVQLSVQLNGQDLGQPQFWTGSVAPNGLSGYLVATTGQQEQQQTQLLTINFLCGQGASDAGPDTDLPTETETETTEPEPAESPAVETSPAPSP